MDDLAGWRRGLRSDLVLRRMEIDPDRRQAWSAAIAKHLHAVLDAMHPGVLGFYWPFRGEFDPRPLVGTLIGRGWRAALPVVVEKDRPLVYRIWTAESRMQRGVLGILVPREGEAVLPDVVLAPLVGFDAAHYRLGNGGGYFDRTLAALDPAPLAIGVGFALGRLDTIHPQPHDRPMNVIVTEEGVFR